MATIDGDLGTAGAAVAGGGPVRRRERAVLLALVALVAARAMAIAALSTQRFHAFRSLWPIDLANINQAIWNTAHGRPYYCTIFYQAPRDHFDPMLMVFSPIYLLTDNVFWLFLAYAALVGAGALALYRLARRDLPGLLLPALLASYYLVFSPLTELTVLEVRGDLLAVPFLLLAWVGYSEERFPLFAAAAALALTCKETVALVMVLWGVLALWQRRPLRWWLTPVLAGLGVLLFTFFVYHPYIQGFAYKHVFFEQRPRSFEWGWLLAPSSWWFLLQSYFSFSGVLALAAPAPLLPALPLVVAPLVWREMLQKSIWLHCLAPAYPFLFVALSRGAGRLLGTMAAARAGRALLGAFLAGSAAVSVVASWPVYRSVPPDAEDRAVWELIAMIPPRASVSAPPLVLAALSTRPELHTLALKDHRGKGIDPLAVDWVLVDGRGLTMSEVVQEGKSLERAYTAVVARVRSDPAFERVAGRGSWELYRRRAGG